MGKTVGKSMICQKVLVSVIIPVYNAESYIRKCLDSILSNYSVNLEVLVIDDGSTDHSALICEEYAQTDERVVLYKKQNGGASSARNVGLQHAKGEWITFVDADDHILVKDWSFLLTNDVDMLMLPHCTRYKHLYEHHNYDANANISNYYDYLSSTCFKTACSKFYKRTLLEGLWFDEKVKVGEDQLFLLECLRKTKSFQIIDIPFYEYRLEDITEGRKYHLSIDASVYAMSKLYDAYIGLQGRSESFEADLFKSFKFLCQDEIDKEPNRWYDNVEVRKIYKSVRASLGYTYRVKYMLLSHSWLSGLWKRIKLMSCVKYQ